MRYIFELGKVPQEQKGKIGGKAFSLDLMLSSAKLNVPEGYAVIDLDHASEDFIREIERLVDTYTEISPSGDGRHIILLEKVLL